MRLSTSTNIMLFDNKINYAISIENSIRGCYEAGYRHIDANLCSQARKGQPLYDDNWLNWANQLRTLGDKLGLSYTQSHAYYPLGNENYDCAFNEELMRRSIITSKILGSSWMVVHPLDFFEGTLHSYKKSLRLNYELFQQWGELCKKNDIGMAIENMPEGQNKRKYCSNPYELIELIDKLGDPSVGACLDTGHAHLSGQNLHEVITILGNRLKATHIADNHQNFDEHFAPYFGTIDWPLVMHALKTINYQNDFSFEIHHLTSSLPAAIQLPLVKFSYILGMHLLSMGND